MSIRPTFFGLYTARSGIVASQANIDVTGQNLSNILTTGYTRQRTDLLAVGDSGYKNRIGDPNGIHIGQGVDVHGISQLRDAGYDIRYRLENTKYGYAETRLSGLEDIGRAVDEYFLEGGLSSTLNDLYKAFEAAMDDASSTTNSEIIQGQMSILNDVLHQTGKSLQSLQEQQESDFKITVDKINSALERISVLNKQIKEDALYNNPAHELKDQRNLLLDELSGYMNIEYQYDPNNLDELSVNFIGSDGLSKIPLVQGDKISQLELHFESDTDVADIPHIQIKFDEKMKLPDDLKGAEAVAVTAADCNSGAVGAYFDLLTGDGNFGGDVENRGIPYYQKMLDTFTNTFAQTMNDTNRGKVTLTDGKFSLPLSTEQMVNLKDADGEVIKWQIAKTDADGNPITDGDGNPVYRDLTAEDLQGLSEEETQAIFNSEKNQEVLGDKKLYIHGPEYNLLSANGGGQITAVNIAISDEWKADKSILNATMRDYSDIYDDEATDGTNNGDNENIARFITNLYENEKIEFISDDKKLIYTGGMYGFLTGMQDTQGIDAKGAASNAKAFNISVSNLDDNRMSVSGVDENEETANMLMFQKAFSASSRILTAMDEMLETLINKTGVVGR